MGKDAEKDELIDDLDALAGPDQDLNAADAIASEDDDLASLPELERAEREQQATDEAGTANAERSVFGLGLAIALVVVAILIVVWLVWLL